MYTTNNETYLHQLKITEKKFNKHLIEKRRRGRINRALDHLKELVQNGLQKDSSQWDKMEKADILELTVQYMAQIKTMQTTKKQTSPHGMASNNFQAGYEDCLNEVSRYVGNHNNQDVTTRLGGHLESRDRPLSYHQDLLTMSSFPGRTPQCVSPVTPHTYSSNPEENCYSASPFGQYYEQSTKVQTAQTAAKVGNYHGADLQIKKEAVWRPWESTSSH